MAQITAFVFAGGGSLGAVQVGMLKALAARGVQANFVVGSSVGAINAACYAAAPDVEGVRRLESIWCALTRNAVFPIARRRGLLGVLRGLEHLVASHALRALIERYLPMQTIEQLRMPCHIVATDVLAGTEVCGFTV